MNLNGPEYTSCKLTHTHKQILTVNHIQNTDLTKTSLHSLHHLPNDIEVWTLWGVEMEKRGHVVWRIGCGYVPRHHV